jgi:acyl carrier protein
MLSRRHSSSTSALAQVLDIVSQIAGPNRKPTDPGANTRLWGGGFWLDSIDLIEVMLACDAAFGPVFASMPPSVMGDIKTVGDLAAVIEAQSRT